MKQSFTFKSGLFALLTPILLTVGSQSRAQVAATCTPTYSSGCLSGDNIDDVTLVGVSTTLSNLNTPCPASGYQDYTGSTTLGVPDLLPSMSYSGTVSTTYAGAYEYVTIWVDWDDNGVFATTEQVAAFGPIGGSGTGLVGAYTIAVPASASPGMKRMRVGLAYSSQLTGPCGTSTWGETHDYKVQVLSLTPCVNPPVAGTATVTPGGQSCPGFTVQLGLSGIVMGGGQTYEWESSPTNVTYTSTGPATLGPSKSVSPLVSTWYRCKVVCSGGTASYSTPVQVLVAAGLSGTYTVNSAVATGGTNFSSFTALAAALNCGIVAPVTVNVVAGSGPYTETFQLNAIGGASVANKVRINGNGETIQFNATSTNNGNQNIVSLNGTKYITIDSLKIKTLSATYGWGVFISGDAKYDTISRCHVDLSSITGTSSINANGIVISGTNSSPTTSSNVTNVYILNNKVVAGTSTGSGGSYYGITFSGNSSTNPNDSIFIIGNEVTNFYYYGIRLYYAKNSEVSHNDIHRSTKTAIGTSSYGVYSYYNIGVKIEGNRIHDMAASGVTSTSSFYGIYAYNYSNTAATPNLIANNALYNLGTYKGTQYLMYLYGQYQMVYNNSIDASAISGSGTGAMYGMYVGYNTGSEFKNNIINITGGNTGTKYGIYLSSTTYPSVLAKNNIYVNSTQSGAQTPYYSGAAFATLAAYQAANPTQEIGSPSVAPQFLNPTMGDLTPLSSSLINAGTNVYALVPTDINGLPRSATPTIGAFEFLPTGTNDGKSVVFISPAGQYCANTATPVKVVIGNGGANSITSMTVNWSVNGTVQTPYSYTNTLYAPGNTAGSSIDTITLGNVTLPSGSSNIVVWVSNPNNAIDSNHNNDTIFWASNSALPGGTYTINSGAAASTTNFQSFNAFKTALSYGICGPVVANVVAGSGPYNEQVEFQGVSGTSPVNTIRINGNGQVLQFNNTASTPYPIFGLNGTQYFTLNNLKIKSLSSTYGWGVSITGSAMRDSIVNCEIDLSTITGTSSINSNGIVISGSNSSATTTSSISHVTIKNNKVIAGSSSAAGGGYYGIVFYGNSSTAPNDSINIIGNEVTNFYYYGIVNYYNKGGSISYNNVHRSSKVSTNTSCYGLYNYYGQGIKVEGNRIHDLAAPGVSTTGTFYGIYNYCYNNPATTPILIANNILYNLGTYSGTQYLMYIYGFAHNVYHNTIDASALQAASASTMYGMYFGYNTGSNAKNNIVNISGGNTGIKYGIYASSTTYSLDLQKNNINVASSQNGAQTPYYYGANFASLAAFQTAYPLQEVGSPSVVPQFISATTGDLSPLNTQLMTSGINLSADVPKDIIGANRSLTPTIGAYEFAVMGNNNARPLTLVSPSGNYCSGTVPVKVMIGNVGLNNVSSLQIHWIVNGVTQPTFAYTSTLVPIGTPTGQSFDTVLIGNATLNTGNNTIKVWTSLPNGVADSYPQNDTLNEIAVPATFNVSASVGTICANNTSILSLSPSSGYPDGALQWQSSTDGGLTWTSIPNTDSVKYLVTNISQNMTYRVQILSSGSNCFSPNATVNVNFVAPPTVIGAESCYPDSLTIYATPSAGNTLKWYESLNTATVYSTNNSLTTPPLWQTKVYYAVSQSSNGCQSARTPVSAIIHELPPVDLGYDKDTCVANGTVVVLNPGTQHPGATYMWDNGTTSSTRSITQSGNYSVVVTDTNTCHFGDTISVILKANPELDLASNGTSFCIGTSKILDAGPDGQNGGSYYWSTGQVSQTISVNTAGTYWVYVTTPLGCTATDTILVQENGYAPTLDGIHSVAQGNSTFSFEAINPQNVTIYAWDFGDGATSTQANPSHAYTSNGIFVVKLTVNSSCADAGDSAYVNIIGLGVNNPNLDAKLISVYPNPNHDGQLTIELNGDVDIQSLSLINVLGQIQQTWKGIPAGQDKIQIQLPESSNGIYQLLIETNKGRTVRKLELMK